MDKINGLDNIHLTFKTAVCLGNFDGLHIGHRKIISALKDKADKLNLKTIIFTLMPHPFKFFGKDISLLSTPRKREELFEEIGVDYLVSADFNLGLASLSPEDFFKNIIVQKLNAKVLVVGEDFRFGAGKKGDKDLMQSLGNNFGIECIFIEKLKTENGQIISSSFIRRLLLEGDTIFASCLLDRPYSLEGTIIRGDGRGKLLGFPTINLDFHNELIPKNGIYAAKTFLKGRLYDSMTYIGHRPTLTNLSQIRIENNIFDFDEDVYGEFAEIMFFDFIRGDKKFKNIEDLKAAIKEDKSAVENALKHVKGV